MRAPEVRELEEWPVDEIEPGHHDAVAAVPEIEEEPDAQDDDAGEAQEQGPDLYYPTLEDFMTYWLAPTYGRHIGTGHGSRTWCPMWFRHPEAVVRLNAVWRAWEHLRQDAVMGMSVFFLEHADPHMTVLLDSNGPLRGCTPERGHDPRAHPLPIVASDAGVFVPEPPRPPAPAALAPAPDPGPGEQVSGPAR